MPPCQRRSAQPACCQRAVVPRAPHTPGRRQPSFCHPPEPRLGACRPQCFSPGRQAADWQLVGWQTHLAPAVRQISSKLSVPLVLLMLESQLCAPELAREGAVHIPCAMLTRAWAASQISRTASRLASAAAKCSGVKPVRPAVASGSAPACNKAATHAVWLADRRFMTVRCSGVMLQLLPGTGSPMEWSAPAASSSSTHRGWPLRQASQSAVLPPCRALTSAPCRINCSSCSTEPDAAERRSRNCAKPSISLICKGMSTKWGFQVHTVGAGARWPPGKRCAHLAGRRPATGSQREAQNSACTSSKMLHTWQQGS